MELRAYLDDSERGEAARLARALGLSPVMLSLYASGKKLPGPRTAAALERHTHGAVLCEESRPDLSWLRVPDPEWPCEKGRPALEVAAEIADAANAREVA